MKQRLTNKEEELMGIFWAKGDMPIRDLVDSLPDPKPHYNTVATLVKFLEEKGFLTRTPVANTYIYKVNISEREYRGAAIGDVVSRYYADSYRSLVSQFVEDEKIDLEDLKALIASIEKNKK